MTRTNSIILSTKPSFKKTVQEATQVSTNRYMDKQNAVHTHNGIDLFFKKEGN